MATKTATPATKSTKRQPDTSPNSQSIERSFKATPEALAALEAGLKHGMKTSAFTNQALVFYAEHLGYLTNSPPSVEARLDVLEYLAFLDRKEKICQKLSDDQLEMAKNLLKKTNIIPTKSTDFDALNDELGEKLPWYSWYCVYLSNKFKRKHKHIEC